MSASPAASHDPIARWLKPGVVAAVACLMNGLVLLLDVPLVDPSEGLHATIAQEMVERGDWITPRLFGEPFRDKPILYFWAEALALATFGMRVAAFRLPGVLLAILGAAATGLLARRLFDARTGLIAAGFHATMLLPTALAQAPVHDVALVPLVTLAILGFWDADHAGAWRRRLAIGCGVGLLLGLIALVKGLPGVAVVGVAYGLFVVAARGPALMRLCLGRPTAADRGLPPLAPLVAVGVLSLVVGGLVAAPWYLVQEARDPGYLRYFFVARHVGGFTTGGQSHDGRPWWYYLPMLLVGGMPAVAYLPAAVIEARGRGGFDRRILLGGTLFFSAANSKLVTYVWPLFPPIAVLAAVVWGRLIAGTAAAAARSWSGWAVHAACLAGLPALPVAAIALRRFAGVEVPGVAWAAILPAAAVSLVPLALWRRGRPAAGVVAGWLAVAAQFLVLMTCLVAPWLRAISPRDLAAAFNARGSLPPRLVFVAERPYSFFFHLAPALRRGFTPQRLVTCSPDEARRFDDPRPGDVFVYPRSLAPAAEPAEEIGRWWLYAPKAVTAGPAAASLP